MKRIFLFTGILLTVACLWFFVERLSNHWASVQTSITQPIIVAGMFAATALYISTFLCASASWHYSIRLCAERLSYRACLHITMVAQFAKFLPGNVGQHIGRVLLAVRFGLSKGTAVSSVVIDMGLLLVAASVLSLLNAGLVVGLVERYWQGTSGTAFVFVITGSIVVTTIALGVVVRLRPALLRGLRTEVTRARQRGFRILLESALKAVGSHCASFVIGTAAIVCIVAAGDGETSVAFHHILGAYALAWMAGFVIPGAPAGIGIREAVLVVTLAPFTGEASATIATALFRVVTTVGDGVAFLIGIGLARRRLVTANGAE